MYEILTQLKTFADDMNWYDDCELLVSEQNKVLENLGYDFTKNYLIISDNKHICVTDINDAIQRLALKNGADLVRYHNGNIGYIGYYNNVAYDPHNCFEIICDYDSIETHFGYLLDENKVKAETEQQFPTLKYNHTDYIDALVNKLTIDIIRKAVF